MATPQMVPMISSDGKIGDVPSDRVHEAVKAGFKVGAEMMSKDGKSGIIPLDRVHDAMQSGFTLAAGSAQAFAGASLPKPQIESSTADKVLGELGNDELSQQGRQQYDKDIAASKTAGHDVMLSEAPGFEGSYSDPDKAKAMTGAGIATGAVLGGAAVAPKVAAALIPSAVGLGKWASANPVKAYIIYNLFKDLIPTAAKKAVGAAQKAAPAGG